METRTIDFDYARTILTRDAFVDLVRIFKLTGQSDEKTINYLEQDRARRIEILAQKNKSKAAVTTGKLFE